MTNEEILEKISCLDPNLLSAIKAVFDREQAFAEAAAQMLKAVEARGTGASAEKDAAFAKRMQDRQDTVDYREAQAWANRG